MGSPYYYVPPPVVGVLHVNAEHLSCLKALHVNVGSFYMLPEAEKLNDLNDQ